MKNKIDDLQDESKVEKFFNLLNIIGSNQTALGKVGQIIGAKKSVIRSEKRKVWMLGISAILAAFSEAITYRAGNDLIKSSQNQIYKILKDKQELEKSMKNSDNMLKTLWVQENQLKSSQQQIENNITNYYVQLQQLNKIVSDAGVSQQEIDDFQEKLKNFDINGSWGDLKNIGKDYVVGKSFDITGANDAIQNLNSNISSSKKILEQNQKQIENLSKIIDQAQENYKNSIKNLNTTDINLRSANLTFLLYNIFQYGMLLLSSLFIIRKLYKIIGYHSINSQIISQTKAIMYILTTVGAVIGGNFSRDYVKKVIPEAVEFAADYEPLKTNFEKNHIDKTTLKNDLVNILNPK